ncbi:GTP-binding protein HSR1 [Alicyclobacillaceae bacterium I2511]|nr:GTP-binding protein HSR1 [Alicyclobacillaceae bacterium I2511]
MRRSLMIGRTNAGKTLFCIRFAQNLGITKLVWHVERTDGSIERRQISLAEVESVLSASRVHHTREMQSLTLSVPRGKSDRQLLLTDTAGLDEGIHPDVSIRQGMAQTLQALVDADAILHVVDAAALGKSIRPEHLDSGSASFDKEIWSSLDKQLAQYGLEHPGYVMLANKMDLPQGVTGYQTLCREYPKHRIIPVSALRGTGFREVRLHVWKFA